MALKSAPSVFCSIIVILLTAGCGASGGGYGGPTESPVPSEVPVPTQTPAPPSAMEKFQNDCENQVQKWRKANADYVTDMSMFVGRTATYSFAIDVNDVPLHPDQVIPSGDAVTSREVKVKCLLRAKLVALGDGLSVAPDPLAVDGWTYRAFTPEGIARWAWSVTAKAPVSDELRVELTPAVEKDAAPIAWADTYTTQFTTRVNIDGTGLDRASYWFNVQFPLAKAIAGTLGLAALGLVGWYVKAKTEWFKRPKNSGTDTGAKHDK